MKGRYAWPRPWRTARAHGPGAAYPWIRQALLGDPGPDSPLDLPHGDDTSPPGVVPNDAGARPALEEVLELRRSRMVPMRRVVDDLTDDQLAGHTTVLEAPGYPPPRAFPVATE